MMPDFQGYTALSGTKFTQKLCILLKKKYRNVNTIMYGMLTEMHWTSRNQPDAYGPACGPVTSYVRADCFELGLNCYIR